MAKKIDYYKKIEELIYKTPKPIYVAFAIHCARDVLVTIKDEKLYSDCYNALAVVEAFNQGLTTQVEVEAAYAAINAAYSAASSAASSAANSAAYSAAINAAYAAINAAYSAASSAANSAAYSAASSTANAAYSAAYSAASSAANSAAHAANSAAYAACVASNAANDDKIKQYYGVLCGMLRNLTKLERIIFNVEEL